MFVDDRRVATVVVYRNRIAVVLEEDAGMIRVTATCQVRYMAALPICPGRGCSGRFVRPGCSVIQNEVNRTRYIYGTNRLIAPFVFFCVSVIAIPNGTVQIGLLSRQA